jgi:hypothetical protein
VLDLSPYRRGRPYVSSGNPEVVAYRGGSVFDDEELPAAWDPFQVVLAPIPELNARAPGYGPSRSVRWCRQAMSLPWLSTS